MYQLREFRFLQKTVIGLILLSASALCPSFVFAQADSYTFSISVTEEVNGETVGVSGVTMYGTRGFPAGGSFTDPSGTFSFNIFELDSLLDATVFFFKEGYSFSPASIELSDCPDGICTISATRNTENQNQLVRVIVLDEQGDGVQAAPVWLLGTPHGCERHTDETGTAVFSIPQRAIAYCSDIDQETANDFYHAFLASPTGADLRLERLGASQSALCIQSGSPGHLPRDVVVRAFTGRNTPPREPLPEGTYRLNAHDREGDPMLIGFWLPQIARVINAGTTFELSSYGLSPQQPLSAIPESSRYVLTPSDLILSKTTCPNGYCDFSARTLGTPSLRTTIQILDTNQSPVSGIRISIQDPYRCEERTYRTTNKDGEVHLSLSPRDCSTPDNAIRFLPQDTRYSFTNQNSFSLCPQISGYREEVTALAKPPASERIVRGTVLNSLSAPFSRVLIYVNGVAQAISREDGTYTVTLPHNTPSTISAQYDGVIFDKEVDIPPSVEEITGLHFRMVATKAGKPFEETPPSCSPHNGAFSVSGIVMDEAGNRVSGATLYNGESALTTTREDGTYSFSIPQGESLWIRAEYIRDGSEVTFTPAAIADPVLSCNKDDFNFQITNDYSFLLTGKVTNRDTNVPLADMPITLIVDGAQESTTTNEEGIYVFFSDGDQWSITPDQANYICDSPQTRSGTVDRNFTDLDFTCVFDQCPNDPEKALPGECGCGISEDDSDQDGIPDCNDGCVNDPGKSSPGECGCGVADKDTDGDGILDCNDSCPTDSNKSEPGICGCGILDTDTDNDGILDCNDRCKEDPLKNEPGLCGCGEADTDSDNDGTPDCTDQCAQDPNKSAAGQCGCGSSDTDTDGDGVADCIDQCVNDPRKSEPEQCGCGIPDTDRDGDGTPDCNDQCSDNPYKITPGICGCDTRDTDIDGDGVLDCQEECPSDPLKLTPGLCGCGFFDTDTDSDGTPDCNDLCATDPNKTTPGQCGCLRVDTDTDGDGTPDCYDQCVEDPEKASPGQCGCGIPDTDTDGDGVSDCVDQCVNDVGKVAPGQCGCGTADTDSDNDQTADCLDECPNDASKLAPGECGCGIPDRDTDRDGTLDCREECPFDPLKLLPGICGCGSADIDTDGDGFLDCQEECPSDALKTTPGICGCGVLDTDSDGDGTPDCNDQCVSDPDKTSPGQCGCGSSEMDSDGDGVADCIDQCITDPEKSSPGQCGCGAPETDSDNDNVADCIDQCPNDRTKQAPGICGCGVLDSDQDQDGTVDCQEQCPYDPLKTSPGICGCGIPDGDSDGDGIPDCQEQCPADPQKLFPGLCGCGTSDTDSDSDGIPDCQDLCSSDPTKGEPGQCGCGVSDSDTDGDGVADCNDLCIADPAKDSPGICGCGTPDLDNDGDDTPNCLDLCTDDPAKTLPGICGCGVQDTDSDRDGLYDCQEACPFDPRKQEPGVCGCGVVDTDFDGDGVANCIDQCPLDNAKIEPGICGCGAEDTDENNNGLMDCVEEPISIEALCVGTTPDGDASLSTMEVISDICWKVTNPNPISYTTLATKLVWESSPVPLVLAPLHEEIICRQISPHSTLQLMEDGLVINENSHPLVTCGATPSEVSVTIELYGRNGKPLTPRQIRRLERAELLVKARELKTSERYNWQIEDPYYGTFSVKQGSWRFKLTGKGASITSRPRLFRFKELNDSVELRWAIRGWGKMFRNSDAGR
ncbi:carboxypeptidase regulatory-like domain-containing protein [bacterium]|nr:carboxypeptidase regulatory-like domain-containing protein [bacterium]